MRFAAIADVHGNPLALEAVIADIRAQDIDDIVNLGDMASGPLDARRTVDALMALGDKCAAISRYLVEQKPTRCGRPTASRAQLDKVPDWLRSLRHRLVGRQRLSCHAHAVGRQCLLA